jgi:hypothetical protein
MVYLSIPQDLKQSEYMALLISSMLDKLDLVPWETCLAFSAHILRIWPGLIASQ